MVESPDFMKSSPMNLPRFHHFTTSVNKDDNSVMSSSDQFDSRFKIQPLSLDAAVAPLLPKATAPFDRSERKRAHTSAVYYSECFLRGIKPLDADSAAKDAQDQYDKWWIDRTARNEKLAKRASYVVGSEVGSRAPKMTDNHQADAAKRRRLSFDESSLKSSNVVSVASRTEIASHSRQDYDSDERDDHLLSIRHISILNSKLLTGIIDVKSRLIENLKSTGGDVESSDFMECTAILEAYYKSKSWDGRGTCKVTPFSLEGNWLTLSKPTYDECKGRNSNGELLYTLGRMSFGMFRPTNLVCSVQASFNNVRAIDPTNPGRPLHVPKKLMKEIQSGNIHLRTYE